MLLPFLTDYGHWHIRRDGDALCYALARRHYSAWKNRRPRKRQFVGPGKPLVLLTTNGDALFVWRHARHRQDGLTGVECSIFRNEGPIRSSTLILEAEVLCARKWPGQPMFTYVDPKRVRGTNPGYCFLCAGWSKSPRRSSRGLLLLQKPARG